MEAISVALTIYALGFVITFLIAVMIKLMMFTIRLLNRRKPDKIDEALLEGEVS
ncbi:MAG: hypothetical protein GX133_10790 [Syntrophomonadaceae bacterium]|nr:hypothetical protein [Syntrophomonadaceae bacterium]